VQTRKIESFSLFEVLVALLVSGVVGLMLGQQLFSLKFIERKFNQQVKERLDVEIILSMVSADVSEAVFLPNGRDKAAELKVDGENIYIFSKRLSWSPMQNIATPQVVTWKFLQNSVVREVRSNDFQADRVYIEGAFFTKITPVTDKLIQLQIGFQNNAKSTLLEISYR
jgi:type II secretory pathway component PulJ